MAKAHCIVKGRSCAFCEGGRVSKANLAARLSDFITESALRRLVELALEEDLGRGDVTSDLLIPPNVEARAVLRSRVNGVIAGLDIAQLVFELVDIDAQFEALAAEGSLVSRGQDLAVVSGAARSLSEGQHWREK